jgi:hypothetical protein
MPVHRKKKITIMNSTDSTPIQSAPALSEQQEFHQHLRDLALICERVNAASPQLPDGCFLRFTISSL